MESLSKVKGAGQAQGQEAQGRTEGRRVRGRPAAPGTMGRGGSLALDPGAVLAYLRSQEFFPRSLCAADAQLTAKQVPCMPTVPPLNSLLEIFVVSGLRTNSNPILLEAVVQCSLDALL